MATKDEHLAQAQRNEQLAPQLSALGEHGWGVTALFYASLHLVQAYLVTQGPAPTTHMQRRSMIARTPALNPIERAYASLKWMSEQSRYECRDFTSDEFRVTHERRYPRIAMYVRNLVTA